jgi:DENN domain-containing protein 11/Domain of unknown function (DUF4484)
MEVYNTSVLATIPPSVSDLITTEPNRLRTLFCIGINDIPLLEQLASPSTATLSDTHEQGWVACTTDTVLALKPHLYDLLITLPSTHHPISAPSNLPVPRNHPTITSSRNAALLPSIRDLRRWKRLLLEIPLPPSPGPDPEFDDLVYARSWTEFIFQGLCWWATAGEAGYGTGEDIDSPNADDDDYFLSEPPARRGTLGEGVPLLQRSDTFDSLVTPETPRPDPRGRTRSDTLLTRGGGGEADVGVMVYFHRMTARMMSSLAGIIDANELVEVEEGKTKVGVEDLMRMGIDWGEREFVREMCLTWFGRDVTFESQRSECCY